MKFEWSESKVGLRVVVRGELEVTSCNCLEHFWERYISPRDEVHLDLGEVESSDEAGRETLARLVSERLAANQELVIWRAPEDIREALRGQGLDKHSSLTLE
ncbi:MAG: STAS domain-containing protein [Planctomycetota bacterium]